jgi:hypothetical protein
VKNRFQAFAFKCNLYRYDETREERAAREAEEKEAIALAEVGLYKFNPIQLTHSLKPPGFNP